MNDAASTYSRDQAFLRKAAILVCTPMQTLFLNVLTQKTSMQESSCGLWQYRSKKGQSLGCRPLALRI